jgi:hypothetical protein
MCVRERESLSVSRCYNRTYSEEVKEVREREKDYNKYLVFLMYVSV